MLYWNIELCDKYQDMFAKPTGTPTHHKFTHHSDLIDKSV